MHLAFEDHRRPGSGGGGARTHEIDRRLARRHQVTVVTARYRGASPRTEDGVHYRPLGVARLGYHASIVTYHAAVPLYVLLSPVARRADVVVEDFAVPHSSDLVPLWTRRPTVAVVQWLFAAERGAQYHLPLERLERRGIRLHRRFIAVSGYIAGRITELNPGADVRVVYAGVEPPPALRTDVVPGRVLYLGRLDWGPKGLDRLVDTFSRVVVARGPSASDLQLVVAGDGPDGPRLQGAFNRAGVGDRVRMVGRVTGLAKWELLASAALVLVPSRYETFGLVAAEASAVGTPVVGFDIPSLREIVTAAGGRLVAPGDTGALAEAVGATLADPPDPQSRAAVAAAGNQRFDWDAAADAHQALYLAAAGRPALLGGADHPHSSGLVASGAERDGADRRPGAVEA